MSELKIVVTGASGRMGRTLIREIAQGSGITLCGALEMEGHPNLGLDSGTLAGMQPNGIKLTADPLPLLAHAQAVVDFTTPMVSTMLADLAAQARIVHVIGTTGFDDKGRGAHPGRRPPCRDRQVRQYEHGRESAGGAGGTRRQVAARLRYRGAGNAPSQQGGCAVRHRAAAGQGRRQGPRTLRWKSTGSSRATATTWVRARMAASALPPCAAAVWWASIR